MVEHSTGRFMIYVEGEGYLLRSIDGWGKTRPEFVPYPEWAIALTLPEARQQRNLLWWHPWKIKTSKIIKRK